MSNGLQLGSVSEMVGGVGSALAVLVALFIAFIEWRRANRLENADRKAKAEKHNALVGEADRLAVEIAARCQSLVTKNKIAMGVASQSSVKQFLEEIGGLHSQLQSLQRFPSEDPRLYVEIGRLKTLCEFESGFFGASTSYVGIIAERRLEEVKARRAAIEALKVEA